MAHKLVENHHNLKENLMLKEKDKIFKNLYGFEDWKLEGAKKRGIWSNTKELIKMGSEKIVEEIKNSQLRGGEEQVSLRDLSGHSCQKTLEKIIT